MSTLNKTNTNIKSVLVSGIAKGHTNQQIFNTLRTQGHPVTYQQVISERTKYESTFNSSFAAIFQV